MKERLQNSTSYPIVWLMVSSTDHTTAVTGITPTVTISKNGGSFASPAGAVSEIGNGWYALAGNATDRNTLGAFLIHATGTGADPADAQYTIVSYDPFDAAALGLTRLDAAVSSRSTYSGGAVASVTAPVTVGTNNDKTGYALSASGVDLIVVETGLNLRQANAIQTAALAGVLAGANGTTVTVAAAGIPATNRITAGVDGFGNRTSVSLNPPA